ncbi:MAG: hypothetical protein AB7F86_15340 [Bdellovibrionales bacterium]
MATAELVRDPFSSGSDLWILPPPRISAWFPRIDWYLNWQMSKGLAYSGLHLPSQTLQTASSFEIEVPTFPALDSSAPLLILSQSRLPSPKCLVLDQEGERPWLKRCNESIKELGARRAHMFLPEGTATKSAEKIWREFNSPASVTFSANEEAQTL